MKPMSLLFAAAACLALAAPLSAKPVVGEPAPAFSGVDSHGGTHALSEYKGKTVVLEWSNPDCPFVKKHYGAGNLLVKYPAHDRGRAPLARLMARVRATASRRRRPAG